MDTILMQLARAGVDTINPQSRNSGWLEWIERGTLGWDDDRPWPDAPVDRLTYNLRRA